MTSKRAVRGLPVRKSVFEVADSEVAQRIVAAAKLRRLPCEIQDAGPGRPLVIVTHREYERDAAEMVVKAIDPTARRVEGT